MMMRIRKILLLCWMLILSGMAAAQPPASEYEVKAAFLFNFIKFVEWPRSTFSETNSPYVIGVLGKTDPFFNPQGLTNYLEDAVSRKILNDRRIVVRRSDRISNLKDCHLLFVTKSERNLREIFAVAQENHILTVSEMGDFCERGGIINFVEQSGRVRFEINPKAAEEHSLKISSKLLNVAKIVPTQSR